MVHFTKFRPAALFDSRARCTPRGVRVTPFGHPGINACVLLPPAFRGLPRPSSLRHPKASACGPFIGLAILFSRRAPHSFIPRHGDYQAVPPAARRPRRLFFLHQKPSGFRILLRFPSLVMSNIKLTSHILMTFMEIRGFEPLTLGLQSRCSSQLS